MFRSVAYGALVIVGLAGCTSGSGEPTKVTCPTTAAPTYASFGQMFFGTFCTPCHSASSPNRNMAPDGLNFDTEAEIRANADDINMMAGIGPEGPNTTMPDLSGPVQMEPTTAQRTTLAQFLACEEAEGAGSTD